MTGNLTGFVICGVIEKSSGDLLRAGYVDFSSDGSFNPSTQEMRVDTPCPPMVRGLVGLTTMHRWNGVEWLVVPQPDPHL